MFLDFRARRLRDELAAAVDGPVFLPGSAGYRDEVTGHNLSAVRRPAAVVGATSAEDIAFAVQIARRYELGVTIKATGHGALTEPDGTLLITTARMRSVEIDPERGTARIAAGATWRDVIDAAAPHGLVPLSGSHDSVGAVGYTLGGGLSPLARTFGFAADHVRAFQVVTSEGRHLTVDAESHPDLFWALCGGKGGLALVSEMTIELVRLDSVYGGPLIWGADDAAAVLRAYSAWTPTLPDEVTTSISLLRMPDLDAVPAPLRGRFAVQLDVAVVAAPEVAEALLAPMRLAARPMIDMAGVVPPQALCQPGAPMPQWDKGVLLGSLPDSAVGTLLAHAGPQRELPFLAVQIRHLGGALAASRANAVGGRDAAYLLFLVGAPVPQLIETSIPAAADALLDAMSPWTTGGTLANFVGTPRTESELAAAWSTEIGERLDEVRRRWNGDGVLAWDDAYERV
ncbi:FAD-binding oxidoreductase [Herbiconiux sp. L3-i23]|uniref:FAD-binding oxidoreductase n=1 Tax=Herbiconiux sp. L3-i23 TaxID=2905871 RepID=UPI00204ECE8D|nr:FAD-dependent oxidoreductase [Herbiconiux sp. L3-i23]BDI22582.1 FAD-linked oxidase [Herbiconiux sp. L3-i23]